MTDKKTDYETSLSYVDSTTVKCSHKLQPIYTSVSKYYDVLDGYRCLRCGRFFDSPSCI